MENQETIKTETVNNEVTQIDTNKEKVIENNTGVKTFTEEEVTKLKQSSEDKIRTEYTKKMKAMEEELNKYKPKEKSQSEIEFEQRIKALEDREKQIQAKEKEMNITNKLKEQGLNPQLSKYLQGVEDIETEISSLKEIFKSNTLDNTYKPVNHKSNKEAITKEQFKNMSYMNRMNLFKTNEELYKLLSK